MITAEDVRSGLDAIRRRIDLAGGRDVTIVAVTKTFGADAIVAAVEAGCRHVGENYAQELLSKRDAIAACVPKPTVHFIGHLQTNKVKSLIGVADRFDSVDRMSVVTELARRAPGARVLIQVNVSGEASKSGCHPTDACALVVAAQDAGLTVDGLMTIGRAGPQDESRAGFRLLRQLSEECGVAVLSMGMSQDLEIALEEGATEVRIGSALFGARVRHP